jgi:hypothetical protein
VEAVEAGKSLADLHSRIRARISTVLVHVEVLTNVAPFYDPVLDLLEDDLREALEAVQAAVVLSDHIIRSLAGPLPKSDLP